MLCTPHACTNLPKPWHTVHVTRTQPFTKARACCARHRHAPIYHASACCCTSFGRRAAGLPSGTARFHGSFRPRAPPRTLSSLGPIGPRMGCVPRRVGGADPDEDPVHHRHRPLQKLSFPLHASLQLASPLATDETLPMKVTGLTSSSSMRWSLAPSVVALSTTCESRSRSPHLPSWHPVPEEGRRGYPVCRIGMVAGSCPHRPASSSFSLLCALSSRR